MNPAHLLADRFQFAAPEGFSTDRPARLTLVPGSLKGLNRYTRFHLRLITGNYAICGYKNQHLRQRLLNLMKFNDLLLDGGRSFSSGTGRVHGKIPY